MLSRDRAIQLNDMPAGPGPVIYWMSRDQRVRDNWALLHARVLAVEKNTGLLVAFCLAPSFLGATWRAYGFMLRGLRELEKAFAKKQVPFVLLHGEPHVELPRLAGTVGAGAVVTDFDPLKPKARWRSLTAAALGVSLTEVDTHNIVPCRVASTKQEYAARTFRPRINKMLDTWLTPMPALKPLSSPIRDFIPPRIDWDDLLKSFPADRSVSEVSWIEPGEVAAAAALRRFIKGGLARYHLQRNDPCLDGQSGLSPYLHFGQIAAQRVALAVRGADAPVEAKEAFLEELIVRRELAENFCFYNDRYDRYDGLPAWAKATHSKHRNDPRTHSYSYARLEAAETHDRLWNAAQRQMLMTGRMHGYMRMYWGKKIFEWSKNYEKSINYAIRLNDRYELDGRDPNGYTGIAWCIGGLHDRPWPERPVFGTVRYMSAKGCSAKFDTESYIRMFS